MSASWLNTLTGEVQRTSLMKQCSASCHALLVQRAATLCQRCMWHCDIKVLRCSVMHLRRPRHHAENAAYMLQVSFTCFPVTVQRK